jgi:anti-sigma-K factor RskA
MSVANENRAAEFVLGLLEGEAKAQAEHDIRHDPAFASQVQNWQNHLAALDAEFVSEIPPGHVWANIESAIPLSSPIASNDNSALQAQLRLWKNGAFAASALAACFAAALFWVSQKPEVPVSVEKPPVIVAQLSGEIAGLLLSASYQPDNGLMQIRVDGMPETPTEPEIWVKSVDGQLVSIGQVGRKGVSRMTLSAAQRKLLTDQSELILTMEPQSNTPHVKPSGAPVATGKASFIS